MDTSLNSFVMIFGQLRVDSPSPKAALAALSPLYGIGISTGPDIAAAETAIARQCVVAGKAQIEAEQEAAWLNSCCWLIMAPQRQKSSAVHAWAEYSRNLEIFGSFWSRHISPLTPPRSSFAVQALQPMPGYQCRATSSRDDSTFKCSGLSVGTTSWP